MDYVSDVHKLSVRLSTIIMSKLQSIIFTILICIDQSLKYFVNYYIPYNNSINCIHISNLLNIIHMRNSGIAFGLFHKYTFVLLTIICILLLVMTIYLYKFWYKLQNIIRIALCFIISGGLSNLIDRLFYNSVIDFIDIGINMIRYPAFNTADMYIFIGLITLFININKVKHRSM
jgi:signal peptidase II